jgi:GT2 family glycosyltransferase
MRERTETPTETKTDTEASPETTAETAAETTAETTHDLVVSIINYRTGEMTIRCVAAALDDLDGLDARIVVVDNRSEDGSAEAIERWIAERGDPRVTLVRSPVNTGFSGGHNRGIAEAPARAYLILNSDTLVRPGALRRLLAALDADPGLGVVAPRLTWEDGTPQISCFRFHSPISELIRGAASGPVTRLFKRWEVALSTEPDPDQIDWMSFACVLARREVLREIGGLDEGYFLYFEDADCCLRVRRAGWRVAYLPEARVVHLRGGSGPVKALTAQRKRLPPYWYASRARFFHRAYGWSGLIAANLLWHLGRGIALVRLLTGRGLRNAIEREARDIWTNALSPTGDSRAPGG